MRGPFPIMSTPYFEDGAVDYAALQKELVWTDESGCPGVIWCQSNDAVDLLTTDEKFKGFEACAKAAEGRRITLALGANGTITVRDLATHSGGFDNSKPYMTPDPRLYFEKHYAKRQTSAISSKNDFHRNL